MSALSAKERWAFWVLIVPFGLICIVLVIALIATVSPMYWQTSVIWTILLFVLFGVTAALRWLPGTSYDDDFEPNRENGIEKFAFCEGYERSDHVIQPICTWSNLAFVAAGLLVVLIAGTRSSPVLNPMADPNLRVALVYGLVVIFLGPGSMLFHASGKNWAGWFDSMSMAAWASYGLTYTLSRVLGWPLSTFWIVAIGLIAAIGVITAIWSDEGLLANLALGIWFLIELVLMVSIWIGRGPGFERPTAWFIGVLVAAAAAFACWLPSGGKWRVWCDPDSPIQGHGFWHIFAAIASVLVYMYFALEAPV